MKYYLTLLIAFACWSLYAQCPTGDVLLTNQAEVDAFVATYPDCTEINGYLQIGATSGSSSNITDVSGLRSLTSILGFLDVILNDSLPSLNGLDSLISIGESLSITANDSLTNLSSLERLTFIGGSLFIGYNNALTSISSLENITSIGGALAIESNISLTNLNGLDNVTSTGSLLSVRFNDALTSLSGLDNLTSVDGYLSIAVNPSLTNLNSLSNLTSIGLFLRVSKNAILTSLSGLENIDATTITVLAIKDNPQLSTCAIQSICDFLGVDMNLATVENNSIGCESREVVEMTCVVSTTDISQTNIELFPNPTNGKVQLRNITAERVEIFTSQGQRIASYDSPGQELDLSALPAGVYHLHLIAVDGAYVAKVVKR